MIESFFFICGSIVGSFLNVCIHRWPQEKSIAKPSRSYCPHCEKTIPWYDNVPFVSYIVLRGRCRFCQKKISFRYFFVELVTAVTFVGFYRYFGLTPELVIYLVMVSGFIVATFVDFGHRIIPDQVTVGGMWVGLFFSLIYPALHQESARSIVWGRYLIWGLFVVAVLDFLIQFFRERNNKAKDKVEESEDANETPMVIMVVLTFLIFDIIMFFLLRSPEIASKPFMVYLKSVHAGIIGVLVGGGTIYAMGVLGDFLFKKESMGGGDVKLMAMMGAFLGWQSAFLTFFIAPFFGAIYGIIEKIRTKDTAIAYGPFLVLAALIVLFFKNRIIYLILNQYGLL